MGGTLTVPLADGTTVDLHNYPVAEGHEDFAMLVEAKGAALGWTAAVRGAEGDLVLSLKNPADFPVTFLWFSNGGRYYPPWSRRHLGVLGIEEGRAYSSYGHAASVAPNPRTRRAAATARGELEATSTRRVDADLPARRHPRPTIRLVSHPWFRFTSTTGRPR